MYQDLMGDAISSSAYISDEMKDRIKLMLDTQDPNIIIDLQINNGIHGTKFDIFWNELSAYFNKASLYKKFLLFS
jgi:hypothetical protein